MTLHEQVFDIKGLPDEIHEKVLTNISLAELMAFESVSKRWQTNVSGVIKEMQNLSVLTESRQGSYYDFVCGCRHHSFSPNSTITVENKYREQVVRLLAKMTNLVAVSLPSSWQSDNLTAALSNCSKLEHLGFTSSRNHTTRVNETKIPDALSPKLTCLSSDTKISHRTIKKMKSLKRFRLNQFERIPIENLTTMLNNGLVSLAGTTHYENLDTICELGSELETFSVTFYDDDDSEDAVELNSSQVRQIVHSMPRLKKLTVHSPMESLELLKDLDHLEDLRIYDFLEEDAYLFEDAIESFGHRLKALYVENLRVNSILEDIPIVCPNLERFTIFMDHEHNEDIDFVIECFHKMTNLQFLNYNLVFWSDEQLFKLLDGLPNLRGIESGVAMSVNDFENFKTIAAQKYPKLFLDLYIEEGHNL